MQVGRITQLTNNTVITHRSLQENRSLQERLKKSTPRVKKSIQSSLANNILLSCPFCHKIELNPMELKTHLLSGDCKAWNEIDVPAIAK